jgi:non-canonical (house-cleaning) NTP pyrophosphatase
MAKEYGTVDLGKKEGYNGWLSQNKLDRAKSSEIAVFLALCGLLKEK